jgi:hypothetical protein
VPAQISAPANTDACALNCCLCLVISTILSQALSSKAGELGGREAVQAIWGLARSRTADKAALDALVGAAK